MKNTFLLCKCKKTVPILGLFTVLRVVSAFLFCLTQNGILALLCDLSACFMLTLFYRLFLPVLGRSLNEKENDHIMLFKKQKLIFALTDTAIFTLKLIFLFLPPLAMGSSVYIHIIAIAVDALLSGLAANYTDFKPM